MKRKELINLYKELEIEFDAQSRIYRRASEEHTVKRLIELKPRVEEMTNSRRNKILRNYWWKLIQGRYNLLCIMLKRQDLMINRGKYF